MQDCPSRQYEVVFEYWDGDERKELRSTHRGKGPDDALHAFRKNLVKGMVEKGMGKEEAEEAFDDKYRLRRVVLVGSSKT